MREMSAERLLSERSDRRVVADDQRALVIKTFAPRTGIAGVLDAIFGDRARRAFRAGVRAKRRGVAVAEPVELRGGALVMRLIEDARPAREIPRTKANIRKLAEFLRGIHDARLYPSDFHHGNVLFDRHLEPHLIDYENLRSVLWVSRRRRIRNLERLLRDFLGEHRVSRATRMRFLRAYEKNRAKAHALWRSISALSEKKRAQYRLPAP
jgi:hypothetical protein